MRVCSVIMAGGNEMRFGPVKQYVGSKQFIKISERNELIIEAILRCKLISDMEDIYIITNEDQKKLILHVLESKELTDSDKNYRMNRDNIITEPEPKGTAYCILFMALNLKEKYKDEEIVMLVCPSDHDIDDDPQIKRIFKKAIEVASLKKKIVTIGIKPSFPATAYGYIRFTRVSDDSEHTEPTIKCYSVKRFKEKPKLKYAKKFIQSKEYFWNSGIFIWDLDVILCHYSRLHPNIYNDFYGVLKKQSFDSMIIHDYWRELYKRLNKSMVDVAILEKIPKDIIVIEGSFGWQDIGKWDALLALYTSNNNIFNVDIVGVDKTNHTIYSTGEHVYSGPPVKSTFVWLYCDEKNRRDVLKVINEYTHFNLCKFDSAEIPLLKEVLIEQSKIEIPVKCNNKTIFLSYCQKDNLIADKIESGLVKNKLSVKRDIRDIEIYDSILKFMKSIKEQDYAIFLISDNYLRSSNCMFEALEMIKSPNYTNRIFPIVVDDSIYDPIKTVEYSIYWANKYNQLESAMKSGILANIDTLMFELKRLQNISISIADFIAVVRDMNNPKENDAVTAIMSKIKSSDT